MNLLDTLHISASGMTAQRARLQAISSNMANARTTRTSEGEPYRRRMPVFQAVPVNDFGSELTQQMSKVLVVDIDKSEAPFREVFDPGHPDADEDGYVKYPNVNILHEMVDLMNTSRTYEANTNVTETTYRMAQQALDMGR